MQIGCEFLTPGCGTRQTHNMTTEDEARAVAKLAEELVESHPDLSPDTVRHIVEEEYHALDGNPVRDFVPPLVGHAVKGRLRTQKASA